MTLDLATIAERISLLVGSLDPERDRDRFEALDRAWAEADSAEITARLAHGKPGFLVARTNEQLQATHPLPAIPFDYSVAATDGSLIAPDRHSPVRFYLLNIGKVRLEYGSSPAAELTNEPDLRFEERDLFVPDEVQRIPVNESILGVKRACAELHAAVDLLDPTGTVVALQDGTLILWATDSLHDAVRDWAVAEFVAALRLFRDRGVPLASYVSAPGSADVMNALRVSLCDYPQRGWPVDCVDCRTRILSESHTPVCDILPSVTDRYLFDRVACLRDGERSALFDSASKILTKYDDDLRIQFFFLNVGTEIARVEIPRWVGDSPELLDRVHAVIYDQAQKGRGYPVALQEAHEMAVISTSDRRLVEELIERQLAGLGIVMTWSGKSGSKRGRFV